MHIGKIFAAIVGLATIASAFLAFQGVTQNRDIDFAQLETSDNCIATFVEQGDGSFIKECLDESAGAAFADENGASGSNSHGAYQVEIDRNGGCAARSDANNPNTVSCTYRDE